MYKLDINYTLARTYITNFRSLGPNAYEAHNPRGEGILHYFVKKRLDIKIIEEMINVIDQLYDGALLEDLEKVSTEEEDVFSEIERQENQELLKLFSKIGDDVTEKQSIIV
tara:strand:+ start:160 stop:492 length:333 start_codon:yes stop_codon:yes gene_type:complete